MTVATVIRRLLLVSIPAFVLSVAALGQNAVFNVTNAKTAVAAVGGGFTAILRENSATPAATFDVYDPDLSAPAVHIAAGGQYVFTTPSGYPFISGATIGYVVRTNGAGPNSFVLQRVEGTTQFRQFTLGTWGGIGGTLANQLDLQAALDAKAAAISGPSDSVLFNVGGVPTGSANLAFDPTGTTLGGTGSATLQLGIDSNLTAWGIANPGGFLKVSGFAATGAGGTPPLIQPGAISGTIDYHNGGIAPDIVSYFNTDTVLSGTSHDVVAYNLNGGVEVEGSGTNSTLIGASEFTENDTGAVQAKAINFDAGGEASGTPNLYGEYIGFEAEATVAGNSSTRSSGFKCEDMGTGATDFCFYSAGGKVKLDGAHSDLIIDHIKASSGQRFVCVDTVGKLVSSTTACSGT